MAEDAANACYENDDVLEIKKYLAMPADKLIKEQLKRAKATDDPDRVVNREIKLKALMLETFGASFSFEKVAALRDASDWASRKSFFSSAATRASLAEGFLVYDSRPIHLALTEPPADYAEKKKFDKKAACLFKGLLGFMGCTKHPYPETLCAEALETALNDPAPHPLRLELYCQLMKQLSGAAAGDVQARGVAGEVRRGAGHGVGLRVVRAEHEDDDVRVRVQRRRVLGRQFVPGGARSEPPRTSGAGRRARRPWARAGSCRRSWSCGRCRSFAPHSRRPASPEE